MFYFFQSSFTSFVDSPAIFSKFSYLWPLVLDCIVFFSSTCLFSRNSGDFDAVDVLFKVITYITRMLLVASIAHKHHAILESCILDFLDLVSCLTLPFELGLQQ